MKNFFNLNNLTLFVALALSTTAEYYSIIGLATIFSGAAIPVMIMGAMLGIAKITTTVWLRKYWDIASLTLKLYLVPAVIVLALITSAGIFGFLSKAHSTSSLPTGDIASKVSLIDEKIVTLRENIKSDRVMLAQMDTQVNDIMSKGTGERSVERSVMIRKQQAPERAKLLKDIEVSNNAIQKLNEERAPIASELRNAEAEVGPIKFIAALIYGDNPDAGLLEKAVVWMIILLVIVFDPLAIALVLAANHAKEYEAKKLKEETPKPEAVPEVIEVPAPFESELIQEPVKSWSQQEVIPTYSMNYNLTPPKPMITGQDAADLMTDLGIFDKPSDDIDEEPTGPIQSIPDMERPGDYLAEPTIDLIAEPDTKGISSLPYIDLGNGYAQFEGKKISKHALFDMHPEFRIMPDGVAPKPGFGSTFPRYAVSGQVFTRVDMLPNRVYKFTGSDWINIGKDSTTYLTDEYIGFLVTKIGSGEYDIDDMTDAEREAIELYLTNL